MGSWGHELEPVSRAWRHGGHAMERAERAEWRRERQDYGSSLAPPRSKLGSADIYIYGVCVYIYIYICIYILGSLTSNLCHISRVKVILESLGGWARCLSRLAFVATLVEDSGYLRRHLNTTNRSGLLKHS